MAKIEHVEPQFAEKLTNSLRNVLTELHYYLPENYQPRISLLDAKGRKKRSNASADNWSPEYGRMEIRFEPSSISAAVTVATNQQSAQNMDSLKNPEPQKASGASADFEQAESESLKALLRSLDNAESRPGWNFVPLRKFRDEILPAEDTSSLLTDIARKNMLGVAIDRKLILVGKVENPKAPAFPVTTIRLNRLNPEVQKILGSSNHQDLDFHPIKIAGESLSTTILRERR